MKKFNIKESHIIAALPFIGYIAAYNYEKSYLSFFNIPSFFIKIGVEEIITATSAVTIALLVYYLALHLFLPFIFFIIKKTKNIAFIKSMLLVLIMIPLFVIGNTFSLNKIVIVLAFFLFAFLYFFRIPLLFFFKGSTLKEKKTKADNLMRKFYIVETYVFSKPTLQTLLFLFLAVCTLSLFANRLGTYVSSRQKNYFVFSKNESCAVIRNYGDKLICIGVDQDSKSINNKVLILPVEEKLEFSLENLGPLVKSSL